MSPRPQFSDRDLIKLILPLFAERLLSMLVGVVDTLMVSYVGEAAVSGISLINQLNNVFIFIFGAAASGGTVIASQYLGKRDRENSGLAASQLIMITMLIAVFAMAFSAIFRKPILSLLFAKVENDVMQASDTYMVLSALSFPALALYNSDTAIFRSIGNTSAIMKISIFMNVINVLGNTVGIFVLNLGVAGVAVSTLLSRVIAAVISLILVINNADIKVCRKKILMWDNAMLKRIFGIAVPSGVETGVFQLSKVAISSIVALFGTMQIAAYAAAQNIWSLGSLFCIAMGYAFTTVIGQCIGANNITAAQYYSRKMLRITYIGSFLWNGMIIAFIPFILGMYNFSTETNRLIFILVIIMNICNSVFCPLDFSLSDGLRAAGDAKYTMLSSVIASVICRIMFSVLFGITLKMGVIGIAAAMICDRIIKALLIFVRYKNGKWTKYKLI